MSDWAEYESWKHQSFKAIFEWEQSNGQEMSQDLIPFLSNDKVYNEYHTWKLMYTTYLGQKNNPSQS